MRCLLLICALLISAQMTAQKGYTSFRDKDTHELIYQGRLTFNDIVQEPEFKWLQERSAGYRPAKEPMEVLKTALGEYTMVVVMGTWCSDTKDMLPKLYKVLKDAQYPLGQLTMFGLDHAKKGRNNEEETYAIETIPTIILQRDGKEIGRIAETVKKSVEADLVEIIHEYERE